MPSMAEIYERYADQYDELVSAEDYERNLDAALKQITKWRGKSVFEAGTGTGRVTRIYIGEARKALCCDRSAHMLDFAKKRLSSASPKITYLIAENVELPAPADADIFIEGWSFGHSVVASAGHVPEVAALLVDNADQTLKRGGCTIFIETMGTNVDAPAAPHPALAEFYRLLEHEHGFAARTIRTDYRFASVEEAATVCGFFFGDQMGTSVRERGSAIVPEWTGIWNRTAR